MEKIIRKATQCNSKKLFVWDFCLINAVLFILLNLAMVQASCADDQSLLKDATNLLQQKNAQSAYRLLKSYEGEYAGRWEYDYLLGVSALESGKANIAIFALQRSLATNPKLVDAHVDLGRAFYEINEMDSAQAEFETVLQSEPIKKASDLASHYLSLIESKKDPSAFSFKYYLETVGGYDSNANSETDERTFNGFSLADENIKTPSTYYSLKVGTQLFGKLNKKNSFNLVASISQRENQNMENVDFVNSNAQLAWSYRHRYAEQTISTNFSKTSLAQDQESTVSAFNFGLKFRLIIDALLRLNGNISNLSYSGSLSTQNSIQTMIGTNLSNINRKSNMPNVDLSLFAGESIPRGAQSGNSKNLKGGRIGVEILWRKKIPLLINVSSGIMISNYKEEQSSIKRSDTLQDIAITLTLSPWKLWETSLKTAITKSQSNLSQYHYTRTTTAFSIKRYL